MIWNVDQENCLFNIIFNKILKIKYWFTRNYFTSSSFQSFSKLGILILYGLPTTEYCIFPILLYVMSRRIERAIWLHAKLFQFWNYLRTTVIVTSSKYKLGMAHDCRFYLSARYMISLNLHCFKNPCYTGITVKSLYGWNDERFDS